MKKIVLLLLFFTFLKGFDLAQAGTVLTLPSGEVINVQDNPGDWWIQGIQNGAYQNSQELFQAVYTAASSDHGGGSVPGGTLTSTSVACANGVSMSIVPATPPPPVVTYDSSTTSDSCSYIASWSENWSTCGISGNWNAAGNINCSQTLSWIPNMATASWTCTTENTYVDGVFAGSSAPSCNGGCPGSAPQPAGGTETKTISMVLSNPTTQTNNAYANNSDTNRIQVKVAGATNQNRAIVGWGNAGKFSGFTDSSNLPSDLVSKTGKALSITHSQDVSSVNPGGTLLEIPVTSKTPFAGKGEISFQAGGVPMVLKNVEYSFKKPFVGTLSVKDNNGAWNGVTTLGTINDYKLLSVAKSSLNLNNIGYSLENFTPKITALGENIEIQSKKVDTDTLSSSLGALFSSRINTTSSATSMNKSPGLQINQPIISYQLGGQNIKYFLSQGDTGDDQTPIATLGNSFLGVRVIGGIQGAGKSEFTGQQANISNLYNSEQRTEIRKNAYNHTKSMTSNTINDKIKYVNGDITLPDADYGKYETLVVTNGNVIIGGNLTQNSLFGIIVLKDNYDINKDYTVDGNIYIKPNVTQINAVIYADGGIISVDSSGKVYQTDSSQRTQDLNKQLVLNGSVFTRNTIGGAILAGGKYILPGGVKIDDFDKAMIYDLNYIRRGGNGCDKNSNNSCTDVGEYAEPFVIKYDSRIQTSPIKLFK